MIGADSMNVTHLDASVDSAREIWNDLTQLPFGKGNRLNVVRHADSLLKSPRFTQFISDRGKMPRAFTIFVSDEAIIPKAENAEGKMEMIPPLVFLKTRGALIECRPFTETTAKYAVEWVKTKADIRGVVAEQVLNRSAGQLRHVRDTINKFAVLDIEPTVSLVNELMEEQPGDAFLDALFVLNRKEALKSLAILPQSEYARTLGLVDARLELAGHVHDMLVEKKTTGEIVRSAGNKSFLVPDILPVAKHYDKKRRVRIRKLLALIDTYSDYGAPDGCLELLVAHW